MDENPYQPPISSGGREPTLPGSGWTPLKVLGMCAAILGTGGCGVCGVVGLAMGDAGSVLMGVVFLGVASLCLAGIIAIKRSVRGRPSPPS